MERSEPRTLEKAVLLVTYYFPPAGGSGVQRVLKFVKYLPNFGWKPVVLTARNADYPTLDPSLVAEVPPGTRVIRSRIVEPYEVYRRLTGKTDVQHLDVAILTRGEEEKARFAERVSEWARRTFFIPDARVAWLPFAVAAGLSAAQNPEVRAIVSSAPPYTCHLIGWWLAKRSGKPWVADFRDSWVDWISAPRRTGLARRIDQALEGRVLRTADRVVTVSEGVREDLLSRHPECRGRGWVLIHNGYDPEDLANVRPAPRDDRLTLIYSGSLYGPRHPGTLLEAARRLERSEGGKWRERLRLLFVGRVARNIREEIEGLIGGVAEVHDYVSHREAVARLLSADVALLIVDDMPASKGVLTGKLFEYIGARKPVLALAPPEGEAARLILDNRLGWVVAPGDVEGTIRAMREIFARWEDGRLPKPPEQVVRAFDRRELTRKLASLLEELSVGRS